MSFMIQPESKDARSTSLTLDLPSNNPFRNRATSPIPVGLPSPLNNAAPARPASRNPFLDSSADNIVFPTPPNNMSTTNGSSGAATRNPLMTGNAADLFDNLTLEGNSKQPSTTVRSRPMPPRSDTDKISTGTSRRENIPPREARHRPSRSQEEAIRARRIAHDSRGRPSADLDIFADPSDQSRKSPEKSKNGGERSERRHRPRRNSDTSVLERERSKALDPEEEKKRQERRRRDRERRHKEAEKDKDGKPKKPSRKLDIIDQLDATSIYGTGLFHHDGPFDACNPHRNRNGSRRAPMQAFPKDSLNNVLGGSGPLQKRPDHATFLGNNDEEAFKDYHKVNEARGPYAVEVKPNPNQPYVEASTSKVEPVHGDESMGLGTSTFLEGAPASRKAIQRRETEGGPVDTNGGGLQRKKSLAQKIRGGIGRDRREFAPSGRMTSPEGIYSPQSPESTTPNGTTRKASERNPFFNEFEPGKGDSITIVEPESRPRRARAPSSPQRGIGGRLERRVTSDGSSSGAFSEEPAKPMGFLSRVKSLKGGPRKPKPDMKIPAATPGQAI